MSSTKIIGVDLGATNIRGTVVHNNEISDIRSERIRSKGSERDVVEDIFSVVDRLMESGVKGIGIGVPSVVDVKQGIVYDVQHIGSWKEVHLKKLMEERYNIPVYVNNDANCFALGEYYFGKGKGFDNMIGMTIGTGLGAGIIINKHLYAGSNCGAGEFGTADYLANTYEYYCSGSFFQNMYQLDGEEVFKKATQGNPSALKLYEEFGLHIGEVIKLVMYTFDPPLVILGGSVSRAFNYFKDAMWERVSSFAYTNSIKRLQIKPSELENSALLGAAALYYDSNQ